MHTSPRWSALAIGIALVALSAGAHAEARYDAATRTFRLDGGEVTYAFGINDKQQLQSAYWGGRVAAGDALGPQEARSDHSSFDLSASITPSEYPAFGGGVFSEVALKTRTPQGVRDAVLTYQSHQLGKDSVEVRLRDIGSPLEVTLHYTVDPQTGIVGRWASIHNAGSTPLTLDRAASAAWSLPVQDDYRLHYMTGRWAGEWQMQRQPVSEGATVLESRRNATGQQNTPWFAIDRDSRSNEDSGPVWFGTLAWSGSWQISVARLQGGDVRVVGGYNPFDFAWPLAAGQTLDTPVMYAGYSSQGMGGASRLQHRFQNQSILPGNGRPALRKVLYNSWEATTFAVDVAGQMALAEKASRLGVERFVVDDGWFKGRNSDHAGLGDWTPDPAKFPNGLKPLIDKVHGLGMEFGLWVEPEMVNPDSDLYRAHPDWVINFPDRPRTPARNQLMLNLARTDVRDHLFKVLDELLTRNDIQYIKWDYNRNISEPGWPEVGADQQQTLYVEYVRNLYWIFEQLRKRHPNVEFESCSGGGGRVDLGIMALTDQVWPSDNTDPYERLAMQDNFTHAFTPAVMMAWVTDSPNWANKRSTSLEYRFLSSMAGGLGIGADLNHWNAQDMAVATQMVAAYKQIRATVQQGERYRLIPATTGGRRSATLSVASDKRQAALFLYQTSGVRSDNPFAVQLQGLDPQRRYRISRIGGGELPAGTPAEASGAYWMQHGVGFEMTGDLQARGYVLQAR